MRAALVAPDGLVVNVVVIAWDSPWVSPPGVLVVSAERPDGSWRYVGPGHHYDAASNKFVHPTIEAPTELAVGEQATITLRWLDEDGAPAAYQQPITVAVLGQEQAYMPGPDGSVQVPFVASVAGSYELRIVEPRLGVVLATQVVTVS